MKNVVIKYGLIAGILLSVYILISAPFMTADSDMSMMENIGNSIMLITFALLMYFGLKKFRDEELGGYISFGQVFIKGLLITLLAGVVYSITWVIYTEVADVDFGTMAIEMTVREMQEEGASNEDIETVIEQIESFLPYYENRLVKFLITILEPFFPGIIAALVLGFVLKRKENKPKVEENSTTE